jgi:putative membrane protein
MAPWAWIWMLVWIVALLIAVWLVVRAPSRRTTTLEDALAILQVRYARGEITQAEYEHARDALLDDQERAR